MHIIEQITHEFLYPFRDPREDKMSDSHFGKLEKEDLFYCLIDESKRTFRSGMIV